METPPVIVDSPGGGGGGGRRHLLPWTFLSLALFAGTLWLLREVEPRGQFFYPRCWMYALTGIQCPGCGGLRATHALLNGDLATAWRLNPLAVSLVPVAGWVALTIGLRQWRGVVLPNPFGHRYAIAVLVGLSIAFTIGRNWPR
jgi:hypothetical protein